MPLIRTTALPAAVICLTVVSGCAQSEAEIVAVDTLESGDGRATGFVYYDRNQNRKRDPGERGLPAVGVSNGRQVVLTDGRGRYVLPVGDDTAVFVIKPSGWMTPVNEDNLPGHYYLHKLNGSPALRYAGVKPTGPLPASIDFPLVKQSEPNEFRMVLFGDPQPYTRQEVYFLAHDVIEELVGVDAVFGVSLGDLVGDDLSLFEPLNQAVAQIGIPWYNVLGNHDINYDAPNDEQSDETFEAVYGPACYAFNYAQVHFIVVDDVVWSGAGNEKKGSYLGGVGGKQLEFIGNDLAATPPDRLVVLMMHIPLETVGDRQQLFELLDDRPHTLSLAAHHHRQHHEFFDQEHGWGGERPHHHLVNATTSGSWWHGILDEEGIPHATMRDGAPNGYSIVTFDGNRYEIRFKAARRPPDHQMTIFAPDEVSSEVAAAAEVCVNVFAGSPRSTVEMRFGEDGPWVRMRRDEREDPFYRQSVEYEEILGIEEPRLPKVTNSEHVWVANLPANPPKGCHTIHVRTTDMFERTWTDHRIIWIR